MAAAPAAAGLAFHVLPCRWALGLGPGYTGSLVHQRACAIRAVQMHVKKSSSSLSLASDVCRARVVCGWEAGM